ncbi:MAG: hypothetical protein GXZ07_11365 [Firmicutes bacterium]|nr:hypothetical protein [Bacillota bacterium]
MNTMGYRDRFMTEFQEGRMNLTITEKGYNRYAVNLYPNKLAAVEILLHLTWIAIALFFAIQTSNMGLLGTVALSLGGMVFVFLAGRFMPAGLIFGGIFLILGIAFLPYFILAGPIGLYGLSSFSRSLSQWYGKNLVARWSLGSEDQFLRAVSEGTIIITLNKNAPEETKKFFVDLINIRKKKGSNDNYRKDIYWE